MTWLLKKCLKYNGDLCHERDGYHCRILVERNRPIVVDYRASGSGSLDNRRPWRTRQGVGA